MHSKHENPKKRVVKFHNNSEKYHWVNAQIRGSILDPMNKISLIACDSARDVIFFSTISRNLLSCVLLNRLATKQLLTLLKYSFYTVNACLKFLRLNWCSNMLKVKGLKCLVNYYFITIKYVVFHNT